MIGLSFIMKCLCPHSCLGSVITDSCFSWIFQLVAQASYIWIWSMLNPPVLLMFYPPSPHFPASPISTGLPAWRAHVGAYLKVCLVFVTFLFLVICTLHLFVFFVYIFASCVCSSLFFMSICVAMVNAHEVEQGPRVSLWLIVVLTQTLFLWAVAFFLLDHKGKYFSMARGCVLG